MAEIANLTHNVTKSTYKILYFYCRQRSSCCPVKAAFKCLKSTGISARNTSPNILIITKEHTVPTMVDDCLGSGRLFSLYIFRDVAFFGILSSVIRYCTICVSVKLFQIFVAWHKHGIINSGLLGLGVVGLTKTHQWNIKNLKLQIDAHNFIQNNRFPNIIITL